MSSPPPPPKKFALHLFFIRNLDFNILRSLIHFYTLCLLSLEIRVGKYVKSTRNVTLDITIKNSQCYFWNSRSVTMSDALRCTIEFNGKRNVEIM